MDFYSSSSLRGPNSFSSVFLSRLKRADAIFPKLRTNRLKEFHSPKNEASLVTVVGIISLRIASAV